MPAPTDIALDPIVKLDGSDFLIGGQSPNLYSVRLIEGVSMVPELVITNHIWDPNASQVDLNTQLGDLLDKALTVDFTHRSLSTPIPAFSGTVTRCGTITSVDNEMREIFSSEMEGFKQLQTHGFYNQSEHQIDSTPDFLWKDHDGGASLTIGCNHGLLEQMKRNRRCRIFAEQSISDILGEVTGDFGLTVDGEAAPSALLPFVVQYMESDYNFMMRLLQEAGLVYLTLEEGTLTLAQNNAFGTDRTADIVLGNLAPYAYVKARDLALTATYVGFDSSTQTLETADADTSALEGTIESAGSITGEIFDLVSEVGANKRYTAAGLADLAVRDRGITDAFAGLGLIAFRCLHRVLRPGDKLTLPQAGDVHVQTVEHIWNLDDGYSALVTAVAAGLPYHTPQQPHIPRIYGPQTAIVVDNIDPDGGADCRVNVKFNWPDNGGDDPVSAYVRVVQPWAGLNHGFQFVPHPDDEVVVEFMNGDPNFPLITGSVYNGVNNEFYTPEISNETTSTIKTISNELAFFDTADAELVAIQAKKTFQTTIADPDTTLDQANASLVMDPDQISLEHKTKPVNFTSKDETIVMDPDAGSVAIEATNAVTASTTDVTIEGTSSITLKVGNNKVVIDTSGVTLEVGSNKVVVDMSGVTISGTMVNIN